MSPYAINDSSPHDLTNKMASVRVHNMNSYGIPDSMGAHNSSAAPLVGYIT